jgi:hypothetical protein
MAGYLIQLKTGQTNPDWKAPITTEWGIVQERESESPLTAAKAEYQRHKDMGLYVQEIRVRGTRADAPWEDINLTLVRG